MTAGTLVLALAPLLGSEAAADVPAPASVLGFTPGEDRKLADWGQIVAYFTALAAASPRVVVEEVGRTTEGRPFLLVTITSEANRFRLDEIRRANLRLADPRGLSDGEADRLLERGKAIVAMTCAIHSDEVGASLTPLELAYRLAVSQDPRLLSILDQTVLLLVPSLNPDGTQLVAEWYRRYRGTPFEGADPPVLYHKYVGHDLNRDWYMLSQAETRLVAAHVHDRWRPQILHDVHQMGRSGARLFVPPYLDPYEPNIDPALIAATNALGAQVAARLTAQGKKGVLIHGLYDAWSPSRAYSFTHGGVRILSETASARQASPVRVAFDDLARGAGYDPRSASWNFPDPWPGGEWRLQDILDYQLAASLAVLEHAADNRGFWLRLSLDVNRRACSRSRPPYAFVVPAGQGDSLAEARLLSVLKAGAVEVERASAAFDADGRRYPAGSHVISLAQPASGFARTVLERQRYPDRRQYPGGPPVPPYDATAHTLPLLLGAEVVAVTAPFAADLVPMDEVPVPPGRVRGEGRFLALGHGTRDLIALGRLLRAGVTVRWALQSFRDGVESYAPGTLLVPATARVLLEPQVRELGLDVRAVNAEPARALILRPPRVGLYRSWVPSMDEGWTRFVFEGQAEVDYTSIQDRELRSGSLRGRFDAIVLPDQRASVILGGHDAGTLPAEYTGGIGTRGAANLKAFVEAGGTLIALNRASEFAAQELGFEVKDALAGAASDSFFCPGAILEAKVETAGPLVHGLGPTTPLWFESGPAFESGTGRVALAYGDGPLLLSGWLIGEARLAGKAALVEVPLGKGRVVLFGFRPQYRAQSLATYVTLLNALYTSAAEEEDLSARTSSVSRAPSRSGSRPPSGPGR